MKINPVYKRELKTSVRSVRISTIIFCYNGLLMLISLLSFYFTFTGSSDGSIQYANILLIYLFIACIEFGMVLFVVPAFTSSAISGERERQTLEILLTTTMKPHQIVLGKLASSISETLLLVVSSLPVLAIIFSVGGIGIKDLLILFFITAITALFIGSIGMFFSSIFKKTVPATIFTYGTLVLLIFGTIIIAAIVQMVLISAYDAQYYTSGGKAPNIPYTPPVIDGLPYIFLINPAVTMVALVTSQLGNISYLETFLRQFGSINPFVLEHWFAVSIIIQMGLSALLLYGASKKLDPIRNHRKKK